MVNDCKIRVRIGFAPSYSNHFHMQCANLKSSFVKGWGSNYSRTHIDSCECWFEIQLLECLSWLDHVLSNMAPPGMGSS